MKAIELFAGAGGMALGVHHGGFQPEALIEFDAAACETLRLNQPKWPVIEGDVRGVNFAQYSEIDLLTGGAPCQPFSTAGARRLDQDERNMWPEVLRAIRSAEPKAVLLENVKGMLVAEARPYFDRIIRKLEELGYLVSWRLLNCANFGVPQRRERVFIVALRRELGISWTWPVNSHGLDALLHAQWTSGDYWKDHGLVMPGEPPLVELQRLERLCPGFSRPRRERWQTVRDFIEVEAREPVLSSSYDRGRGLHVADYPAATITTRWNKTLLREDNNYRHDRCLTIRELSRLQTFPDSWTFSGEPDDQLRQVGNAVPTAMAAILASAIRELLSSVG